MTHRLPNGKTTNSDTVYVKAWRKLAHAVAEAISTPEEKWEVYGYDPDITLSNRKHLLELPVRVAERIVQLANSAKERP